MVLFCSVALVVDNLKLYNKIAARLRGSTLIKFVIVLWGSEESLGTYKDESKVPFYSYDDLMISGRTSRQALAAVASSGFAIESSHSLLFNAIVMNAIVVPVSTRKSSVLSMQLIPSSYYF